MMTEFITDEFDDLRSKELTLSRLPGLAIQVFLNGLRVPRATYSVCGKQLMLAAKLKVMHPYDMISVDYWVAPGC